MKIIIPIIPTPQMRARHSAVNGFSRTYKHEKQAQREKVLMVMLKKHRPKQPLQGEIMLGVKVYLPVPTSKPKKWKEAAARGEVRPTTKPDLDNLIKQIKDCLTMMRFWEDDKQVVGYLEGTGKYYSEKPRWEVEIEQWNQ